MSDKEKRMYEAQLKVNPALRLASKTRPVPRPEEIFLVNRPEVNQVEKIDLLNRLIKHLKTL